MSDYKIQIDLIRICAIACVVTIHVVSPFLSYSPFFETPTYWVASIIDAISRVGVPMLVMISGYLNMRGSVEHDVAGFIKKRTKRIVWPLIAWCFIYFLWSKYYMHFEMNIKSIYDLVVAFFRSYYHMYFMYLILGLTLITPILKKVFDNMSKAKSLLMIYSIFLIAMIVTTVKGFYLSDIHTFETTFTYFMPYIAYYLAGYYYGNKLHGESSSKKLFAIYLTTIFATILLNYLYMLYTGWGRGNLLNLSTYFYFFEYFSPTVILMSVTLYILTINSTYLPAIVRFVPIRVVQNLSNASFGVYLIHPMIINILNKFAMFDLSRITSPVLLYMILKVFLVVTLSYILVLALRRFHIFQYLDGSKKN